MPALIGTALQLHLCGSHQPPKLDEFSSCCVSDSSSSGGVTKKPTRSQFVSGGQKDPLYYYYTEKTLVGLRWRDSTLGFFFVTPFFCSECGECEYSESPFGGLGRRDIEIDVWDDKIDTHTSERCACLTKA